MLGNAINLAQTQPGTFADGFRCKKWIEHLAEDFRIDAFAIVNHGYHCIVASLLKVVRRRMHCRPDDDGAAARHGVFRVDCQIQHRKFDLVQIRLDIGYVRRQFELNADGRAKRGGQQILDAFQCLVQIEGGQVKSLSARERQQLTGQFCALPCRLLDGGRPPFEALVGRQQIDQVGVALDDA